MATKRTSKQVTTDPVGQEDFRRVSAALVESERRFRRMADATLDVIWITDLEPENVVYVSPSFERIWGRKAQDLYDNPHLWIECIHPEDRDRVGKGFGDWITTQPDAPWETEYRVLRPDGGVRWIIEHGVVISEVDGPKRVSGISKDVTDRRLMETALRESEERFALSVAGSADGIWDWDVVSGQMFISARGQRLYGLQPGIELRPRSQWLQMIKMPIEDEHARDTAFDDYLAGRADSFDHEWRISHPDGSDRWVRLRGLCVRDAQGLATRFSGSITDIDERKRTEQALAQSEQRHALAMKAAQDGFWDWATERDSFYASPRTLDICGFPANTLFSGRADFWNRMPVLPEDQAKWTNAEKLVGGLQVGRFDLEFRLHFDGAIRWIFLTGLPSFDGAGKVTRWTGSVSDITGRKTSEAALRESEERFALAVAGSNDGLWDWEILTDRMFFSDRAQRIYGLQPGKTMRPRKEWREMVCLHPDDVASQIAMVSGYLDGTLPAYDGEWRVRDPDGSFRWIRIRGVCVRDAQGQPVRMAGSVSDIESHKRAQAALQQSQRLEALGTLAGGIAHDFNNILGAILGFGELTLKSAPADSRLRRDIESIMTAGERGRALVERILAFSRSGVTKKVPVQIESVVREAFDLLSRTAPNGLRLELALHAGNATAMADAGKVHQVVINLVTNAIQAMPDGGTLQVAVECERVARRSSTTTGDIDPGEYIFLTVSDTGGGIDPAVKPRIFDPFFTTKDPGTGTGLGLSLVHGIVTEMGGAIDVSTTLGIGSAFKVYLPRIHEASVTRIDAREPVVPRGSQQQVLVVDDEATLVELTTERLRQLGYVCVGYTSSADALAAFQAHPDRFDAIVSDERMPGLSGVSLIKEVRIVRSDIPIVLLSGYVGDDLEARAHAVGATRILGKPSTESDLAVALAAALGKFSDIIDMSVSHTTRNARTYEGGRSN